MHKRSFGTRVWIIADKYNIEQTQVHKIITSYISYCRGSLLNGYEVSFLNLVTMIPDSVKSDYRETLAFQCKNVAKICAVSYYTVFSIIKEYLSFLYEDLVNGNSVDLRGIVTLHPISQNGVIVKIHSSTSESLKRDLDCLNGCVTSVRAHTHKLLKHSIKSKEAITIC